MNLRIEDTAGTEPSAVCSCRWGYSDTNVANLPQSRICSPQVVAISGACASVASASEVMQGAEWEDAEDIAQSDAALAEARAKGTISLAQLREKHGL